MGLLVSIFHFSQKVPYFKLLTDRQKKGSLVTMLHTNKQKKMSFIEPNTAFLWLNFYLQSSETSDLEISFHIALFYKTHFLKIFRQTFAAWSNAITFSHKKSLSQAWIKFVSLFAAKYISLQYYIYCFSNKNLCVV
jgi:hypothetical protein